MYYCLIASLQEHTLGVDPKSIDFEALRSEILAELSPKDLEAVRLLYSYYDVVNILSRLVGRDTAHNALGNLSEEEIEAEINMTTGDEEKPFVSKLPQSVSYALSVIKGRADKKGEDEDEDTVVEEITSEDKIEKLLLSNFYLQCQKSKSKYLRRWAEIDRQIREVCAGEQLVARDMENVDMKEISWYLPLQGVLSTTDFVEREHKMDSLRWAISAELLEPGGIDAEIHQFDIAAVLNYLIELNILQRWASLSKEIGRERFEAMVASFTSKGEIENK